MPFEKSIIDSKSTVDAPAIKRRDLLKTGLCAMTASGIAAPFVLASARAQQPLAGKVIGFSQSVATDEWLRVQRQDVIETAQKHGMRLVITDARENPAQEVRNLEDLAVRGVDIVIMITYFAEAVQAGVRTLNEAGIPIVVMSSALAGGGIYSAHLSADTLSTAQMNGRYYVDRLGGSGKVAQIEGRPGSTVNQARGKGWHDIIDAAPGIEVVARGVANYARNEALLLMQDFLQANRRIDAVYCHNDNMAKGAIQAIEESGRANEMWVTGYDAITPETLQMIEAGRLHASSIYPTFGAEAVEVAAAILEGKPVKKDIVFPSPMVTIENLDQFYDKDKKKRIIPPVDMAALGL